MQNLHPKNWNVVCWATLLFWTFISVGNNIPFGQTDLPDEIVQTMPDGRRVAVYDVQSLTGWPFSYAETWRPAGSNISNTKHSPGWLVANIAICILTLCGVVLTIQIWFPRFSIKEFLFGVGGIAVLITIGMTVFSTESRFLQGAFIYSLFFAPIISGAVALRSALTSSRNAIKR